MIMRNNETLRGAMRGSNVDVARLIAEIHKRPALWNQKHVQYLNREATTCMWTELSAILKIPKPALKTKWKGLRDTFRTELKKEMKYRRTKSPNHRPTWMYFMSLQFLREQMMPKPPVWEHPIALDNVEMKPRDLATIHGRPLKYPSAKLLAGRKIQNNVAKKMRILGRKGGADNQRNRNSIKLMASSSSDEATEDYSNVSVKEEPDIPDILEENGMNAPIHYEESISNCDDNFTSFAANNLVPIQVFTPEIGNTENSEDSPVDPIEGINHYDDNYHFLMSLLPHFNKLSDERRMLLRMHIQEAVYKEVYKKIN